MTKFYNFLTKKALLSLLIVLFSMAGFSATYYVSNTGSDTNSGLSTTTPWKTLAKVNTKAFVSGDIVLLKSGDKWYETLTLSNGSGNVTISSYGGTVKPEIRGYGEISGWTSTGSWSLYTTGIYRMATSTESNRLWINGKDRKESKTLSLTTEYPWRWEGGYLYIKAPSNPATYFKSIMNGLKMLEGTANIVGKANVVITNINFSGNFRIARSSNITVSNCDIGYRTDFYGITITGAAGTASNNIVIKNCNVTSGDSLNYNYYKGTTNNGVYMDGTTNSKIHDNYFYGWSHCGVSMSTTSSSYPLHNNEVFNNYITAPLIDYSRGLGSNYQTNGYNNSFHHNTVVNTSVRSQFNGNGLKVHDNIIDNVKGCSYPEKQNVGNGMAIEGFNAPAINMEIYNNTITNCANEGIWITSYNTVEKAYNNIHDNNVFNNNNRNYQQIAVSPVSSSIHHNKFVNNHLYSPLSSKVVGYAGTALTVDEFNAKAPLNGDVISGNNAKLTYSVTGRGNVVVAPSDIRIEYNGTPSSKTVSLPYSMIDLKGVKYSGSITLQPFTSVILLKDLTTAVAPSAPTSVVATAGNASAKVTFAAPSSNGGSSITGYTVTSIPAGGTDINAGSTSLTHSITGLTNGVSYTFVVKATNAAGTSVASTPSNAVIPKSATTVAATSYTITGPTAGNVNSASGSFTITPNNLYTGTITITPTGIGSTGLTAKVLTFTNSSAAQTFTITPKVAGSITLTATNNGSLTNPVSIYFKANPIVPSAPTSVVATAGNASATVTFAAPSSNGGSSITGYTVTSIPAGGTDINAGSTSLTHSITGLTNGVSYTFVVKATNAAGTSVASANSNAVIPRAPLSNTFTLKGPSVGNVNTASANFTVTPSKPFTGSITITFSGQGSTGLSPKVLTFSNSSTSRTFTITPYYAGSITLIPSNNGGFTNPASLTYNANPIAPGAPTSVVATPGNGSATVTFAASTSNGGSYITGYTVTSIPAGGVDLNAGSRTLSHVITGLANGVSYTFTVKAINSVGTSVASAPSNSVIVGSYLKTGNGSESGQITTSIEEEILQQPVQIDVFPNPSTGSISVRFSTQPENGSRVDILDLSGKRIVSRTITGLTEEFNLDQLTPGVYVVKSILGLNEHTQKLIITK